MIILAITVETSLAFFVFKSLISSGIKTETSLFVKETFFNCSRVSGLKVFLVARLLIITLKLPCPPLCPCVIQSL